jgi:flagellar biosynthetic protein FliR
MTPEVVAWLARSFDVGVTLAMPATAVCLASQLALAFVARAAPSLNVFQIGLPVTLAAGFGAAAVAAPDVGAGLAEHFGALREAASHVLSSPRP